MNQDIPEIILSGEDRRLLALWAADCAERVLPLFEAASPSDARPREAVEGARAYVREGRRTQHLRSAAWAALAAAREASAPAVASAARSAGLAAATPYLHARATPHQINHVLGPAVHQALAREIAAGGDPSVGDAEIRWAAGRAGPAVRGVARQLPPGRYGRSRSGALHRLLDAELRG
ncbi:putative immunity protein [Streptomyces sp. NPDC089799]|uniref:putative immunity protein n=1 Tax=Streptomyces sp. NPDC089799 TaxID=3155066 RepID=UPI003446CF21